MKSLFRGISQLVNSQPESAQPDQSATPPASPIVESSSPEVIINPSTTLVPFRGTGTHPISEDLRVPKPPVIEEIDENPEGSNQPRSPIRELSDDHGSVKKKFARFPVLEPVNLSDSE